MNRDLSKIIVLDTDPSHLRNQPENAIILPKWKGEPGDKDLVSYIPFLEFLAASGTNDIRPILAGYTSKDIPTEYAQREARARKLFYESKAKEKGGGRLKSGKLGALVRPQSTMQQRSELTGKILPTYDGETYIMDFVRTRGQAAYEEMAENLRVNGEKFLAESEAMEKADHEARKKELKESLSIGNWVSRLFSDEKSEGQSKEES